MREKAGLTQTMVPSRVVIRTPFATASSAAKGRAAGRSDIGTGRHSPRFLLRLCTPLRRQGSLQPPAVVDQIDSVGDSPDMGGRGPPRARPRTEHGPAGASRSV